MAKQPITAEVRRLGIYLVTDMFYLPLSSLLNITCLHFSGLTPQIPQTVYRYFWYIHFYFFFIFHFLVFDSMRYIELTYVS